MVEEAAIPRMRAVVGPPLVEHHDVAAGPQSLPVGHVADYGIGPLLGPSF